MDANIPILKAARIIDGQMDSENSTTIPSFFFKIYPDLEKKWNAAWELNK